MFKFKKKQKIILLSTSLVFLCILLLISDDDVRNLMSTTTVASLKEASTTQTTTEEKEDTTKEEITQDNDNTENNEEEDNSDETIENEDLTTEEEITIEPVVYEGMTLEELASKLERNMKNELSGYGYLYASYSLERGVDPYLALAITLEETGCNYNCSGLVVSCNNVGGMKGSGCGDYGYFNSLSEGIKAFIDNIANNYVAYGLTTAETMNSKYAENPAWSTNVNNYITIIKNN